MPKTFKRFPRDVEEMREIIQVLHDCKGCTHGPRNGDYEPMKNVIEFAEELSDAYSADRYKNGFGACIKMLRKRGYDDRQIEAILRSKWTRWAGDGSEHRYGQCTASDLAKFLDSFKDRERAEVEALTREHWSEVSQ
jgi:hypothetical protein